MHAPFQFMSSLSESNARPDKDIIAMEKHKVKIVIIKMILYARMYEHRSVNPA